MNRQIQMNQYCISKGIADFLTLGKTCNVLELWNFGARRNSRYHLALCKYVKN